MIVELYISWLNYLGGFEYFLFTAQKEYDVDIEDSRTVDINMFPEWPASYGITGDTIRKQTFRNSRNRIVVRSQLITLEQLNALAYIKTSPCVQIIYSRTDRRTVIVDTDSFKKYDEGDKQYILEFSISYTDPIPSQSV
jgi:hypothetical protein